MSSINVTRNVRRTLHDGSDATHYYVTNASAKLFPGLLGRPDPLNRHDVWLHNLSAVSYLGIWDLYNISAPTITAANADFTILAGAVEKFEGVDGLTGAWLIAASGTTNQLQVVEFF